MRSVFVLVTLMYIMVKLLSPTEWVNIMQLFINSFFVTLAILLYIDYLKYWFEEKGLNYFLIYLLYLVGGISIFLIYAINYLIIPFI